MRQDLGHHNGSAWTDVDLADLVRVLSWACEGPHTAIPDFHPVMVATRLCVPLGSACALAALLVKEILSRADVHSLISLLHGNDKSEHGPRIHCRKVPGRCMRINILKGLRVRG